MTMHDDLELRLVGWLADEASPREVELDGVFVETRTMEQRHPWSSVTAWRAGRMTGPRFRAVRLVPMLIVVALTVVGLILAAIAAGSRPHLPPPVGPARSGLVAVETDGDIYVVKPDGTGRTLLVGGPGVQFAPTWSPDGTRLAYWSGTDPRDESSLWVVNADGSSVVGLTRDRTFYDGGAPIWAPDGKRLSFATRTGELRV